MHLNHEQKNAVDHFNGPCVVTATPGSGKTRVLTHRVARLIERGIDPKSILCLTFTNKAAAEMKGRITSAVGSKATQVWISTFHSFFISVLRKYGHVDGIDPSFSVYNTKDQDELMQKISRMHDRDYGRTEIYRLTRAANDSRENLISLNDYQELDAVDKMIVLEYFDTLKQFNAVDFSGILYLAYNLIHNRSNVRQILTERFRYILGDEWQDTNKIQYETIKTIASHGNIFVVADKQQAIYGFRGARPQNVDAILVDFERSKEIVLPKNYRSTSGILQAAQNLIQHNEDAKQVTLDSVKGRGHDVVVRHCLNPEDESFQVVRSIQKLKEQNNYKWNDFAILYRTNALSKVPEMTLRRFNIPYRIHGGFSFFDRSEIKTSLAYLSFLVNEKDTIAFARAIQFPKRQIGATVIGRLERECQSKGISILAACRNADSISGITQKARKNLDDFLNVFEKYRKAQEIGVPMSQVAGGLLTDSGYYGYMKEQSEEDDDSKKRIANIDELLISIADYQSQNPDSKLIDYIQSIEIAFSDKTDDSDAVTLLTMHASKGLEFESVHIIGLERDIMPHKMAVMEGSINEERRLLYVSATRSKSFLHLSHCRTRRYFNFGTKTNRDRYSEPSPFLEQMRYAPT